MFLVWRLINYRKLKNYATIQDSIEEVDFEEEAMDSLKSNQKNNSTMKMNEHRQQSILLFRYHTVDNKKISGVYASYAEISRLCKVPYSTVRRLCIKFLEKR